MLHPQIPDALNKHLISKSIQDALMPRDIENKKGIKLMELFFLIKAEGNVLPTISDKMQDTKTSTRIQNETWMDGWHCSVK